ncbi:neuronal acetylcholine receptor subunit beta-3-like [Teleopsis dalmanni]|uniref:neuronal acetylcholine receptor subunit beta-3-like n=1 Tax=Teleopsis dalmanni TaxID=139649 RepID=UPI0018CFB263|nr:neuronal acetylcholine receptor subunit beta-3-like [Teleopsis dalmanni]
MFTSGCVQYCAFSLSPKKFFVFFLIFLVQRVASEDSVRPWNYTTLDQLRMQLFMNYDKFLHPTYRGAPTNITLGMTVNYIDIDEINGKMTLHGWARIRWMDDKRSWNVRDNDNITQMHLRPTEVWKPEIMLFNSAGENSNYLGDTQLILSHDGSILWVPPVAYTAYCYLNLRMWPYDSQKCTLKIGSWTQTVIDQRYLKHSEAIEYDELVQSIEWEIVSSKVEFHRADYYNYVQFIFNLKRRSTMYAAVIFTPASCIVLLALSTFWLPPQMGEKILLNGLVIIVIAIFLMYFAQLLPVMAENTPLIVLFYSSSLLMLSLSTIISTIVLYLSTAKHKRRLPTFIKNALNGALGRILMLSTFTLEPNAQTMTNSDTKELAEHIYENRDTDTPDPLGINAPAAPSARSIQFDWILLATAVDRIFFLFYCITFIALAVQYGV